MAGPLPLHLKTIKGHATYDYVKENMLSAVHNAATGTSRRHAQCCLASRGPLARRVDMLSAAPPAEPRRPVPEECTKRATARDRSWR